MKIQKLTIAAMSLAMIASMASCDKKSNASNLRDFSELAPKAYVSEATQEYTEADTQLADSLATAFGNLLGAQERMQIDQALNNPMTPQWQRDLFENAEYLKGLELVLSVDTADIAYIRGLYTGINIYNYMTGIAKDTNTPMDPALWLKAFKETFLKDSISPIENGRYEQATQNMRTVINNRMMEKQRAMVASKLDGNVAAGKEYQDKMLKDGFKKTDSGLVYRINNAGSSKKVGENGSVKAFYLGKHINGDVFDQSRGEAVEFNVNGVVPGFAEALKLVGEGGSITAVIPSNLAYGENGAGPIEPGETLVFEITVEKVL